MEIQSAFNSGVAGFNNATEAATDAARNIAAETTAQPAEPTSPPQNQNQNQSSGVNLTEEIVNLRVAEVQAQASAQAIQTADDTLGSLLDVRV